jgi:PTS system nitrogen regulatory IIA component
VHLTVKDVAALFRVAPRTVYRWIAAERIPVLRANRQYRFSRDEVLEWARARGIVSPSAERNAAPEDRVVQVDLAEALEQGGIYYRVEGENKVAVLRSAVRLMSLPPSVDRERLTGLLLERELMGSTAISDGIAFPHARNPELYRVSQLQITLCFLEKPLDFGAIDGRPVRALFIALSPSVNLQLRVLACLAFALKDPGFKRVVDEQGARSAILGEARRIAAHLASRERGAETNVSGAQDGPESPKSQRGTW